MHRQGPLRKPHVDEGSQRRELDGAARRHDHNGFARVVDARPPGTPRHLAVLGRRQVRLPVVAVFVRLPASI